MRPQLLDLFCGAGGAAMGYHRAGFEVVGVDTKHQPRYPFEFIRHDALEILTDFDDVCDAIGWSFDAIHASPPCQDHSPLSALVGEHDTGWMLPRARELLKAARRPFVLENVPGAPMRRDLVLCGKMFGLRVKRHRLFELHGVFAMQPPHPRHDVPTATRQRRQRWAEGWDVSITGDVGTYLAPEAMGIDWMTGNELSQAIPPAYTEYIGAQLLDHLQAGAA